MARMPTLDELIREALANARDDGYDLSGLPDDELAMDIASYDAAVAGWELSEICQAVSRVRES